MVKSKLYYMGKNIRLIADAPFEDLVIRFVRRKEMSSSKTRELQEQSNRLFTQDLELQQQKNGYESSNGYRYSGEYFQIPGKVLHVDGDATYLRKCLDLYGNLVFR